MTALPVQRGSMKQLRVGCSFGELVEAATAGEHAPYDYQARLAHAGLPEQLSVPTGAGKTMAATLPWLYRRRLHPDVHVRRATPRRLVVVLPQRALVEQTRDVVVGWLANARVGVKVHVLLGGASSDDREWKHDPVSDAIFVGTQDMVLSRLLLRGYGEANGARPLSFGLLHAGTQFVFDEVQLMGPGLPTSLQLEGLRRRLGTVEPCHSMWMSATIDPDALVTADFIGPETSVAITEQDRVGPLRRRLEAKRNVEQLDVSDAATRYPLELANAVAIRHRSGTRTLVVINTVDRAQAVYDALTKIDTSGRVLLLHSRFRPGDRGQRTTQVLDAEDVIVVSTQVLEAGIDTTSELLVTELAPWPSIVQRAGRCNRDGNASNAVLAWVKPPSGRGFAAPYAETDLLHSENALVALEGKEVTSSDLVSQQVEVSRPVHSQLRMRDLLSLFDTAPDVAGNDIDVSRWIRDADETTVSVAWREESPVVDVEHADGLPGRDELCSVPVNDVRTWLEKKQAWRYDQPTATWRRANRNDIRPGAVFRLLAADGGYAPERGWSLRSTRAVPLVSIEAGESEMPDGVADDPAAIGSGTWISLPQHLDDVERDLRRLLADLGDLEGLRPPHCEAAALAGRYHDLGKAHPVFAESVRKAAGNPPGEGPWAKTPVNTRLRHSRRYFRHELVTALMLLDGAGHLLAAADERDLVTYLAAAHHGKVRMTVRSMTDETGTVLGVGDPEDEPTSRIVLLNGQVVEPITVGLSAICVGSLSDQPSWFTLAAGLRDRQDLGPFRLAFLEAVVRIADQRVSAGYRTQEVHS